MTPTRQHNTFTLKAALLATLSTLLISTPAFSATSSDKASDFSVSTSKDGNALIIKRTPNFPNDVIGMALDSEQSVAKSKELGAVAQYIVGADDVDKNRLDKKVLVQELNDSISIAGQYFKDKPDYKGTLVLFMTYYPGYKAPFQFPITAEATETQREQKTYMNRFIKEHSKCNKEGFCSILGTESIQFYNVENPEQQLNKKDYADFMSTHSTTQNIHLYHTNPQAKPMGMFVYIGINGHLTTPDFVRTHIKQLKNK